MAKLKNSIVRLFLNQCAYIFIKKFSYQNTIRKYLKNRKYEFRIKFSADDMAIAGQASLLTMSEQAIPFLDLL